MWRSGQHEFNGDTSDGTWGYSQFAVTNAITSKDGGFVREGTDGEVTLTAGVAVRWTRRQGAEVDTRGSATLFGVVAGELGGSCVKDWRTSETGLVLPDWIRRKYELGAETHARSQAPSAALWAFPRDVCMESHYPAGVPDEFVTADLADWAPGGGEPYLRLDLMDLPSPMRTPLVDKMVDKDHDWGPSGSGEDRVFFDHICAMRTIRNGAVSPLECSGLWTAPVCRTLLQVAPMGAELHWQTQALIDGILTDVLVRLCRAAAEVYATRDDEDASTSSDARGRAFRVVVTADSYCTGFRTMNLRDARCAHRIHPSDDGARVRRSVGDARVREGRRRRRR